MLFTFIPLKSDLWISLVLKLWSRNEIVFPTWKSQIMQLSLALWRSFSNFPAWFIVLTFNFLFCQTKTVPRILMNVPPSPVKMEAIAMILLVNFTAAVCQVSHMIFSWEMFCGIQKRNRVFFISTQLSSNLFCLKKEKDEQLFFKHVLQLLCRCCQ